jgi:predicted DNA-binding transcriptional regulator AlpA
MSKKQVASATGLSRATIDRERRAHRFPQPLQLSARRIAWRSDDIDLWIAERLRAA